MMGKMVAKGAKGGGAMGGKGGGNIKRKTKLCVYHASGHCPNTNHCTFAHSEEEIGQPLTDQALQLQHQTQPGGGKIKTKICMQWSLNGGCPKGDSCTFAHVRHVQRCSCLP